jgi:hypothetical protein
MAGHDALRRVRQVVVIVGALAVLGVTSGWGPGSVTSVPAALAIHEGNEPSEFGGPWGGGEP